MAQEDEAIRTIEEWIGKFEEATGLCEQQLLRLEEAVTLESAMRIAVREVLVNDSIPQRLFDRLTRGRMLWLRSTASGFVAPQDCEQLKERIGMLRQVADQLAPQALRELGASKRQLHIGAGDPGRALRLVFDLMKRARRKLLIVDRFVDEAVFPLIESLSRAVQVRMLGGKLKPAARVICEGYRRSGRKLDFRSGNTIHDRYLVLDGTEVWSLGTSINGLGLKAHTITQITYEAERDKLISEFEGAWRTGAPL